MKNLITNLIICSSLAATAQTVKPLGSIQARDTNRITGSLRIDSNLRLAAYRNSDTTKLLAVDSNGNVVLREKIIPAKSLLEVTSVDSITTHRITINRNALLPGSINANTALHLVSALASFGTNLQLDGVDGIPVITMRTTFGTLTNPLAPIIGQSLSSIMIGAYYGGGYRNNAINIVGYATENWTTTASGSRLAFRTTPIGTNTPLQRAFITGDGAFEGARIISDSNRTTTDYTFLVVRDSITGEHKQLRYASLPIHYRLDTAITSLNTSIAFKQPLLGYTPENLANRVGDFSLVNNNVYPTTFATAVYINNKLYKIRMEAANYTLVASDAVVIMLGSSSTCTLHSAIGLPGYYYTIKNASGSSITVNTTSSQTIYTTSAVNSLNLANGSVLKVVSDGTNWVAL